LNVSPWGRRFKSSRPDCRPHRKAETVALWSPVSGHEKTSFECCFLQNPLTVLLGKHNIDPQDATGHIMTVTAAIQSLRPVLIYLWQKDTRATLERVARERLLAWQDFLIAYFTRQGWGKAHGVGGWDGVIASYEMRARVELDLLHRLSLASAVIDNSDYDWDKTQREAKAFLERQRKEER
jgi:hypothetical protein